MSSLFAFVIRVFLDLGSVCLTNWLLLLIVSALFDAI